MNKQFFFNTIRDLVYNFILPIQIPVYESLACGRKIHVNT